MSEYKFLPYLIHCLTNLHVGSGNNNYGVIDKEVQRDPISNAPVIHASGLKGSVREYCTISGIAGPLINRFFGSEKNEKADLTQGALRFFDGNILSLPVRGADDEAYYNATTQDWINTFNLLSASLNAGAKVDKLQKSKIVQTEAGKADYIGDNEFLGHKAILLEDSVMQLDILPNLPVIARNSLDNGQSANLWYEEIVPRESRFSFYIGVPKNLVNEFETEFVPVLDGKVIQIGANATVGYGYCKISKII